MAVTVWISFAANIYSNQYLNNAAAQIGKTRCLVSGRNEKELLLKIKEKIWAMSSEATIEDEQIARTYNQWIADNWHWTKVPTEISNAFIRDMRFALPYSQDFKEWLRKNN